MQKIYFAKSNKANPDDVMKVRKLLSKYDIEVVEYSGGTYSNKPLSECQYLLVLPDLTTLEDDVVCLGKGLHQQIESFKNKSNIIMLKNICDNNMIIVDGLSDLDVSDSDDFINYSVAIMDGDEFDLTDFLSDKFLKKEIDTNYYLLISK